MTTLSSSRHIRGSVLSILPFLSLLSFFIIRSVPRDPGRLPHHRDRSSRKAELKLIDCRSEWYANRDAPSSRSRSSSRNERHFKDTRRARGNDTRVSRTPSTIPTRRISTGLRNANEPTLQFVRGITVRDRARSVLAVHFKRGSCSTLRLPASILVRARLLFFLFFFSSLLLFLF